MDSILSVCGETVSSLAWNQEAKVRLLLDWPKFSSGLACTKGARLLCKQTVESSILSGSTKIVKWKVIISINTEDEIADHKNLVNQLLLGWLQT